MEKIKLGIDFGTSNTSAATYDNQEQLRIIPLQKLNPAQPSTVFIRSDRYHSVGFQAIDDFLSADPIKESFHFIPSIKQGLPISNYEGVGLRSKKLDNGRYPVIFFETEEIASYIIDDIKTRVSEQGPVSDNVVIGRPVRFSDHDNEDGLAQTRLETAAKMAGFDQVRFVLEPVAAALYYERTKLAQSKSLAFVFDFGGGTLDTCILELNQQNKSFDNLGRVIASHGISLGGTDLDKDIFRHHLLEQFGSSVTYGQNSQLMPYTIYNELTEWHLSGQLNNSQVLNSLRQIRSDAKCNDRDAVEKLINLIQHQQVPGVLRSVEEAKIDLSQNSVADIQYTSPYLEVKETISRRSYKEAIKYRFEEIQKCINECLNRGNIKRNSIDVVLRVGGSSRNQFVSDLLKENFSHIEDVTELTSVAAGLGIIAAEDK